MVQSLCAAALADTVFSACLGYTGAQSGGLSFGGYHLFAYLLFMAGMVANFAPVGHGHGDAGNG